MVFKKGYKMPEEWKKIISLSKRGPKAYNWKGENVGYSKLHSWVRQWKLKPLLCEDCNIKPPREVANISGKYLRDINDYKWLCKSCHNKMDGIVKNLKNGLRPHPNLGKHLSEETRNKISESHKKNYINGMIHWRYRK